MTPKLKTLLLPGLLLAFLLPVKGLAQGGFGHVSFGPAIGSYSRLQRDLQQSHLLGSDFFLATQGVLIGGGGMAYYSGGLLLGGNGFACFYGAGSGTRGESSITTGAGFFNIGYALHNQSGFLLYPYAGFGGMGTTLELTNHVGTALSLGANHQLQPGQTHKYSASGIALEGGIAIKKLLANNSGSGFIVGLEFGTFGLPAMQAWQTEDDQKATSLTSTHSQGFYVRLSLGGGQY